MVKKDKKQPTDYGEIMRKAEAKHISVLRDNLSAYVSSAEQYPVIVKTRNKPKAVLIGYEEYLRLIARSKDEPMPQSNGLSELSRKDISEIKFTDFHKLFKVESKKNRIGKVNISEEIQDAWIPEEY